MNTPEDFVSLVSKLRKKATGCIHWPRALNIDGYGAFRIKGHRELAHRLSYQVFKGPIPKNMCVLHRCDTPACVNPEHLFLGSRDLNNKDRMRKGRSALGEKSGRSKLSPEDVRDIRRLYQSHTITTTAIGKQYGVSNHQVSMIGLYKSWRHLR